MDLPVGLDYSQAVADGIGDDGRCEPDESLTLNVSERSSAIGALGQVADAMEKPNLPGAFGTDREAVEVHPRGSCMSAC